MKPGARSGDERAQGNIPTTAISTSNPVTPCQQNLPICVLHLSGAQSQIVLKNMGFVASFSFHNFGSILEAPGPSKKNKKINLFTRSFSKYASGRVLLRFWEDFEKVLDGFWKDFEKIFGASWKDWRG